MVKGIKVSGDLIQTSEIQKESLSVVPMIPLNFTNKSPAVLMVCHDCNSDVYLSTNLQVQTFKVWMTPCFYTKISSKNILIYVLPNFVLIN